MEYISFIDILGTKSSSENDNPNGYLELVVNFQNTLLRNAHILKSKGRIHFFSDCAYIEAIDFKSMVLFVKKLRDELLMTNLFLRGSIIKGVLGAVNGVEEDKYLDGIYPEEIIKKYNRFKNTIKKNRSVINGTMFFSPDISKAVKYEMTLKAASIFIEKDILKIKKNQSFCNNNIVLSGHIKDINKLTFQGFYDISYDENIITETFLNNILRHYTIANASHFSFGRYYISILVTCINSTNFSQLQFRNETKDFIEGKPIFHSVLNLRKSHKSLYSKSKGLEFVYFSLVNKVYSDLKGCSETTKEVLKLVFSNKRFLGKYQNQISRLPSELISSSSKKYLIQDYYSLVEDGYM